MASASTHFPDNGCTRPDAVQVIDFGTEKGRSLVTTRPIQEGEVLFSERPLICCQFSWNRLDCYKSCDYCLQPLESPQDNARRLLKDPNFSLPAVLGAPDGHFSVQIFSCPSCGVEYCSEACRAASADEYHAFVCCTDKDSAFDRLDQEWRNSHFPPETGTVMLLVRIAAAHFSAHFRQSARARHIVTSLSRFVSSLHVELPCADGDGPSGSTISLTHRLMGPKFSGSLARLHTLFLDVLGEMAHRTGLITSPSEVPSVLHQVGLQSMLSEYGFCSSMCLIGRNGQGIGTSSLGTWGKVAEAVVKARGDPDEEKQFSDFLDLLYEQLDETAGEFLNVEGVGLYELQSQINHSCEPNTCVRFESGNSELSIVAKSAISAPGTEVTICYFDECMLLRGVHSRRKYLREHYVFLCECTRCVREMQTSGEGSTTTDEEEEEEEEAMSD
uniref:SET domain-containing protein n=1 Tax=Mesocestoides corti TaxID=53468 RepID=A0A5K3FQA9_MESCO